MDPAKYEYQSEFARRYFAEGREKGREEGRMEGRIEGRVETILNQLAFCFGPLTDSMEARVSAARYYQLSYIAEHLLTARTLADALRSLG